MQIEYMIKKIDFHDSSVIELLHEKNKVRLKIDLCMWRQEGFEEGDEELKEVLLEFDHVEDYMWEADKAEADIDYDTILEVHYGNGTLKIVLADDRASIITLKCNTVKFTPDILQSERGRK